MLEVVPLTGLVKFSLTLDPSSWIFDDRKIDIDDFFDPQFDLNAFLEAQKDERAGTAIPRLAKGQKKYKKSEWLTRSFCMPAKIFIENSEPTPSAKKVTFEIQDGSHESISLEEAISGVLAFSTDGKIIEDDGPLHFYSNTPKKRDQPIKGIKKIILE